MFVVFKYSFYMRNNLKTTCLVLQILIPAQNTKKCDPVSLAAALSNNLTEKKPHLLDFKYLTIPQ